MFLNLLLILLKSKEVSTLILTRESLNVEVKHLQADHKPGGV